MKISSENSKLVLQSHIFGSGGSICQNGRLYILEHEKLQIFRLENSTVSELQKNWIGRGKSDMDDRNLKQLVTYILSENEREMNACMLSIQLTFSILFFF